MGECHFSNSQTQSPSWRVLNKSPIPKRSSALQWRVLHCAMATTLFVANMRPDVSPLCKPCCVPDIVFHSFCDCLNAVFCKLGYCLIVNLQGEVLQKQVGAVYLFKRFDWTSKAGHMEE